MYIAFALLAAGSMFAASTDTIRATVPFDFMVGRQTFSAGEYTLRQAGDQRAVFLRDADYQPAGAFLANSVTAHRPQEQTTLVFHRYGNLHFLREIWIVGEVTGRQLPRSAAEMEARMAANGGTPDEVILLAAR
jgi:hypothetical protein